MDLKLQIKNDMKTALKAGEKIKLSVIRMLLAAIQSQEIEKQKELSNEEILQVVEKQIKQRNDSAKQFNAANREDRADQEHQEAEILKIYLPEQLTDEELKKLITDVVDEIGANSMKEMGKVMAELRMRAQGRVDMGVLSSLVKEKLIN